MVNTMKAAVVRAFGQPLAIVSDRAVPPLITIPAFIDVRAIVATLRRLRWLAREDPRMLGKGTTSPQA